VPFALIHQDASNVVADLSYGNYTVAGEGRVPCHANETTDTGAALPVFGPVSVYRTSPMEVVPNATIILTTVSQPFLAI
jgi:hypothetical protein